MSSHGDSVQNGQTVHRFQELFEKGREKIGALSFADKIALLVDATWEKVVYGTSREDYFQYGFYEKNNRGRRTFINHKRGAEIHRVSNDPRKSLVFKNKEEFAKRFCDFLGRDILNMNEASYEEFDEFFNQHERGFVKPRGGTYGRGVETIQISDIKDRRALYESLQKKDVLLEEYIIQHPDLAAFNESSLNSMRVVTYLCADGHSEVMPGAVVRIGRKGKIADNFHHNGVGAQIDIETGVVCSSGIDKNGNRYLVHPDTGLSIIGFRVPHWDKVCETVLAAAKVVPEVRYVGWDVAVTKDGRAILIEGNDKADPDVGQMSDGVGKWKAFKEKIDEVRNLKK